MPSWDIDPAGVQGVLTRTGEVAGDFQDEFTAYGTAMQGSAENSGSSIVASALSGFADARSADLTFLGTRTGQAINGAANATTAYVRGDLQMAADAQSSATAAPDGEFRTGGPGPHPR